MTAAEFRRLQPDCFYLDPADRPGIATHLRRLGVLAADEHVIGSARAGEGNMNCTVRVTTDRRTLIVKQSRPWVEKYPQFAAPWDRSHREAEFYGIAAGIPAVARLLPKLVAADRTARVLVLEDLGTGGDYASVYREGGFTTAEIDVLASALRSLHDESRTLVPRPDLANREMRQLNHAHIFDLPLRPGAGPDLNSQCPGLQELANQLQADTAFSSAVEQLGRDVYLADGPCLLHGDFFPGSLVRTSAGPRLIDPEFCHFGRPEYDVGVFTAHLLLARQPSALVRRWILAYGQPADYDPAVATRLAGVEIMRRIIGYARLPLMDGLQPRREWLALAWELVLCPEAAGPRQALGCCSS